jgi:hydroxybutyrate-dimer hydrolase
MSLPIDGATRADPRSAALRRIVSRCATLTSATAMLSGCAGALLVNTKPAFVTTVTAKSYDGSSDDLLTAGLGKTGLGGAAPAVANATAPTAAELRRLAIYNNYRALVPVAANGGYGTLFGPNIDVDGGGTLGEGKVAGTEYLAYADDGTGAKNVTMVVQVPASFKRDRACIVAAPSSGSRGVYGAIGTAGEWGLKHGCAVAYTDKGTGLGVHDLATDTVNLQDGMRADAASAGKRSIFTASLSQADRASFNATHPFRVAFKHAHSQRNPERDWGRDALDAIRFAFYVLNEQFSEKLPGGTSTASIRPDNTIVIASSVSNGGAVSVAATEEDTEGLIDGLAVTEPTLEQFANPALGVRRGGATGGGGRPLYDYYSYANLYMPCAALSSRAAGSPGAALLPVPLATNRCASLKAKGLLSTSSTSEQAEESVDKLLAFGYPKESIVLFASHYLFGYPPVVATYASAYGRFGVADMVCGQSFAATDTSNHPVAASPAALAQVFATGNGVPPTATINIVNNNAVGGPTRDAASVSASTGVADLNIDAALCQRALFTGNDANAKRVNKGIAEVVRTANLHGKPAIIVGGRADTQIPVTFNERPYYGQNKIVEGAASKLSYIEVTNAQHFDAFIDNSALPGYDSMYVPLHIYFIRAMDAMWAHLARGAPLPPSQVVRTTPRGGTPGTAPAISAANVPPISSAPAEADRITFSNGTLTIPD